jgi:hypothetical protein
MPSRPQPATRRLAPISYKGCLSQDHAVSLNGHGLATLPSVARPCCRVAPPLRVLNVSAGSTPKMEQARVSKLGSHRWRAKIAFAVVMIGLLVVTVCNLTRSTALGHAYHAYTRGVLAVALQQPTEILSGRQSNCCAPKVIRPRGPQMAPGTDMRFEGPVLRRRLHISPNR